MQTDSLSIEATEINKVRILQAGKGPEILFLHPAGQPPAGMIEHIQLLAPFGRVIAPDIFDLAGNSSELGFSGLVRELDNLEIIPGNRYKTRIVGCSLGGGLGLAYAAAHPNEVEFVTTGSSVGWPLGRHLGTWLREFIKMHKQTLTLPQGVKKKDPGAMLFLKDTYRNPKGVYRGLILAMSADLRRELAVIESPVDLLWGRHDTLIPPWSGQKMAQVLGDKASFDIVSPYNHLWVNFEPEKLTIPAVNRIKSTQELD